MSLLVSHFFLFHEMGVSYCIFSQGRRVRKREVGGKRDGRGGWMREKLKFETKVVKSINIQNGKCLLLILLR